MASRGRILVVDDEPSLRGLIAEALATEGYDVHEAADGARALELLR
jgi:two-component system, cell cycle sensor histidine kinase and response regulator CckA